MIMGVIWNYYIFIEGYIFFFKKKLDIRLGVLDE